MLSKGINTLLITALFTFASSASSDEMKTYKFTKAFIDCVKNHSSDGASITTEGVAESALMNGSEVIGGAPLDNNYWLYMNCLSASNSGTESLTTEYQQSCPSLSYSLGSDGRRIFVPPGAEGKSVSVSGVTFSCSGGTWSKTGVSNPGADIVPDNCDLEESEQVLKVGVCEFNLPFTTHNSFATASFDAKNTLNLDGFYSGELKAKCVDGSFEVVESSCEVQVCQPNEEVQWRGGYRSGHLDKSFATCEGNVDPNGYVTLITPESQFYRTESSARSYTKIPKGEARFYCDNGKWKLPPSSGRDHLGNSYPTPTCTYKTQSELNCFSRKSSSGKTEYACL